MNKIEKVKTTSELLRKINTAKDGDLCECEQLQTTFVFKDKGWNAVKTKQKGYEDLYGHETEQ